MGNPHAVQVVADVDTAPVAALLIESHPRFPQRVNAGLCRLFRDKRYGCAFLSAGETLACGTGACAAVVAGIAREIADSPVCVRTRGELTIAWGGEGTRVFMTGPAVTVFTGEIDV